MADAEHLHGMPFAGSILGSVIDGMIINRGG